MEWEGEKKGNNEEINYACDVNRFCWHVESPVVGPNDRYMFTLTTFSRSSIAYFPHCNNVEDHCAQVIGNQVIRLSFILCVFFSLGTMYVQTINTKQQLKISQRNRNWVKNKCISLKWLFVLRHTFFRALRFQLTSSLSWLTSES